MEPQAPEGYPKFAPPADAAGYLCYEGALELLKDVLTPLAAAGAGHQQGASSAAVEGALSIMADADAALYCGG
jgi:hypothetical protein